MAECCETDDNGVRKLVDNFENPVFTSQYFVDFVPLEVIGKGTFGVVFKTKKLIDDRLYAVKRINLPVREEHRSRVLREVKVLARLDHSNIVRYFNAWTEAPPEGWLQRNDPLWIEYQTQSQSSIKYKGPTTTDEKAQAIEYSSSPYHLYIQQEFCSQGSLRNWLQSTIVEDRGDILKLFVQMVDGLAFIHSKGIIHRDLKPDNVFINEIGDGLILKIGDFGLSRLLDFDTLNNESVDVFSTTRNQIASNLTADRGTTWYMSPEQRNRDVQNNSETYDLKVDIYALGIIFFELLQYFPYDEKDRCRRSAIYDLSFREVQKLPDGFQEKYPFEYPLLMEMISVNPANRPDAVKINEILRHRLQSTITLPLLFDVGDSETNFSGREEELKTLTEMFMTKSDCTTEYVVISGLGGIGKTELAKQFAKIAYEQMQASCIWFHGESEQLRRAAINFAENTLQIPKRTTDGKLQTLEDIFKLIHQTFRQSPWILIIDNLEEVPQEIKTLLQSLSKYNPPKPFILMTSRNISLLPGSKNIPLDILSTTDAKVFLRSSLSDVPDASCDITLEKLTHTLQNFPLALNQATSFIQQENESNLDGFTISEYLDLYEVQKISLLNFKIDDIKNDYALTTLTTWNTTLYAISSTKEDMGELATYVLNILAYFAPDNIPIPLLVATLINVKLKYHYSKNPDESIKKAIVLIRKYSMCKTLNKTQVSVHRLVQEVIRLKLKISPESTGVDANDEKDWLNQLVSIFYKRFHKTEVDATFTREDMPHVVSVWRHALVNDEIFDPYAYLPILITRKLLIHNLYTDALELGMQSLPVLEQRLGKTNPIRLTLGNIVAQTLRGAGRQAEALFMFQTFYELEKETLGLKDQLTIYTGHQILSLVNPLNFFEVTVLFEEVLQATKDVYGDNHEHTIWMENVRVLGLCHTGQGDKAWDLYFIIEDAVYKKLEELTTELGAVTMNAELASTKLNFIKMLMTSMDVPTQEVAYSMTVDLLDTLVPMFGNGHGITHEAKFLLVHVLNELGKRSEALAVLNELMTLGRNCGSDHPMNIRAMSTCITMFPEMIFMFKFLEFVYKTDQQEELKTGTVKTERFQEEYSGLMEFMRAKIQRESSKCKIRNGDDGTEPNGK